MQKGNIWLWVVVAVVLLSGGFFVWQSQNSQLSKVVDEDVIVKENTGNIAQEDVDYHAGFAIYTNGTFRIFTAAMYHNLSPDVFIEADNPNIIHVAKTGVTWGDFFSTLPFELTSDCLTTGTGETFCSGQSGELRFFLNGEEAQDLLLREINDGDRALITFGNASAQQVSEQYESVPSF